MAVTDINGVVRERMAYDPCGKRRMVNGNTDVIDSIAGVQTDRGFTMHEHLDEIGLINMNARMYDPYTGRFLSADPFIQYPDNLQSYNRYSYVLNNPLAFSDPSGYFSFKKLFRVVAAVVISVYAPGLITEFLAISAGTAAAAGLTGGAAAAAYGAAYSVALGAASTSILSGAIVGFAAGAVASGSLKGGLHGALSGGLFGAAGTVGGCWGGGCK